jgi:PAS domain S-box-containing protein
LVTVPGEPIFRGIENEADLVTRLRYLEGMERIRQALAQDLDSAALLQGCVETVLDLFGADRCLLAYPCDPASDVIRLPFLAERPDACLPPLPREFSPVSEPVRRALAELLERSEPMALGPDDPSTVPPDGTELRPARSRLTIAIRPKTGPAWNLTLHQCLRDREWTPEEMRLFRDAAHCLRASLETLILTQDLRASEAFLHAMTEGLPHLLWTTNGEGKIEYVNRRWMEYTGQSWEQSLGPGGLEAVHPDDRPLCTQLWSEAVRTGRPYEAELRYRRADGIYLWHLARAYPVLDAAGKATRWIGTCTDISEAKRAREETEHAREQLATILSGAADAILALEPDGKIVYANDAAAKLFDLPSARALIETANRMMEEERRVGLRFTDENGDPVPIEKIPTRLAMQGIVSPPVVLRFRPRPEAPERWVIAKARPIFDEAGKVSLVISLTQDITELKAKEEAVRRLEKLESLGKLAGGVAHDFNNLLVTINGYSEMGLAQTADRPELREYFEEILRSGQRAAALTQQLLAYGRKQMMRPRRINLNAVVGDMQMLLARVIGEDIRLRTELCPDLPPVQADPSQIEQVIMNLIVNARDAMPSGGTVTLRTETTLLEAGRDDVRPGPHVALTVADTGLGMDPAVLARAFEPFFTTKRMGSGPEGRTGTGLGLASVYGIVKQCGGHIEAESEPGRGSTFRIYLPVADGEEAAPGPIPHAPRSGETQGVILLVEDEDSVRHFTERVLAGHGFRILSARGGNEALALAEAEAAIDLVLTDVVMPRMRGPELAARVRQRHPDARILLMSGYPDDTGLAAGEGWAFLQKPYRADQLLEKVEELLNAPAGDVP